MSNKTLLALLGLNLLGSAALAEPLGTAFTYQGRLVEDGQPAGGWYALRFTLWDAGTNGHRLGQPQLQDRVAVSNGLFTVTLDFGQNQVGAAFFSGEARWLEIGVEHYSGTNYVTLVPRQPLTPTPYAIHATAAGSMFAYGLIGTVPEANLPTSPTFSGTVQAGLFQGSGAGLTSLNASQLTTGKVPDARLSTNVALLNSNNTFTGTVQAAQFQGGGAGLTGLNASQLTTGTVPDARLSANVALHNGSNIFVGTVRAAQFQGDGGGLTDLNASQLTTGLVPNARFPGNPSFSGTVQAAQFMGGGAGLTGLNASLLVTGTVHNALLPSSPSFSGTVQAAQFLGGGAGLTGLNASQLTTGTVQNGLLPSSPTFAGTVEAAQFLGGGAGLTGLNASQLTTGTVLDARLAANVARTNQVWLLNGNVGTTAGLRFLGTKDDEPLEFKVNNQRALRLEPASGGAVNVIGGSAFNTAGADVAGAAIGGGQNNTIQPFADMATIGGGLENTIQSESSLTTIGGGCQNTIQTNADSTTIGGGNRNGIHSGASFATIGGGSDNTIQSNALYATIGGGWNNTIQSNAFYATIGGGWDNTILTNAIGAAIPGGRGNEAAKYAFAAGNGAHALHIGAFVWSDFSGSEATSTRANSVTFRGSGGYRFFTSTGTVGAELAAGSSSWTVLSDRNAKENFEAVNPQEVLDKVAALPLSRWNYKTQPASVRHLGPMAQDFHAAFAVGETDTGITTVDADGVALAAIQGLNQKLEEKNAALAKQVEELKALVETLARKVNGGGQ